VIISLIRKKLIVFQNLFMIRFVSAIVNEKTSDFLRKNGLRLSIDQQRG